MKKLATVLVLSASILGLTACGSEEKVENNADSTDQEQTVKVEKGESIHDLKDSEIIFSYDGEDVTGKDLKEYANTYMDHLGKDFNKDSVIRRYILQGELLKESLENLTTTKDGPERKYTEEDLEKDYAEHVEMSKGYNIETRKGLYYIDEIASHVVSANYFGDEELLTKLYNNMTDEEKKYATKEYFVTNMTYIYREIKEDKTEYAKLKKMQQQILNDSGVKNVELEIEDGNIEYVL